MTPHYRIPRRSGRNRIRGLYPVRSATIGTAFPSVLDAARYVRRFYARSRDVESVVGSIERACQTGRPIPLGDRPGGLLFEREGA